MRADETDFGVRPLRLDGLGHFAIVLQRRRGGVDDDVVEILRNGEAFREINIMGRAVQQPRWDYKQGRHSLTRFLFRWGTNAASPFV